MTNDAAFFTALRASGLFGSAFEQSEVDGCNAILSACRTAAWPLSWQAYGLATAYHETGHTMQPVKERGGDAYFTRLYDVHGLNPERARAHGNTKPGDGIRYCGRGYVQLTWAVNYQKAGHALGLDLVGDPDAALRPSVAATIMVRGMAEGWFTGKRLADYLPAQGPAGQGAFEQARRIINGTDRAEDVAHYARAFQDALMAGDQ